VSRGLAIFLGIVVLIAIVGFWGLPYIKQKLFGESMTTRVDIVSAVDAFDVEYKGKSVSKTVVEMDIYFPMGSAPENAKELQMVAEDGRAIDAIWKVESKEDIPEKGLTKWMIRPVFFEIGFRAGTLKNKYRDLCFIRLANVKNADQ
jgi:hypothetical protein